MEAGDFCPQREVKQGRPLNTCFRSLTGSIWHSQLPISIKNMNQNLYNNTVTSRKRHILSYFFIELCVDVWMMCVFGFVLWSPSLFLLMKITHFYWYKKYSNPFLKCIRSRICQLLSVGTIQRCSEWFWRKTVRNDSSSNSITRNHRCKFFPSRLCLIHRTRLYTAHCVLHR